MFISIEFPFSYNISYCIFFRIIIMYLLTWGSIIGIISVFIIVILFILAFIIASYYFSTYFTSVLRENSEGFNIDYNKKSKQTLEKYGDNTITKAFLVKRHVSSFVHNILSILSLYKWDVNTNKNLYHTFIVFETINKQGDIKYIRVEKTHSIQISPNFEFLDEHTIESIKLKKKKTFTIHSIFDKIRHTMGDNKFFNFNLENNCQRFTSNIIKIIHIDKNTSMKKYQVFELPFSGLSFYMINWCVFFGSFIY